MAATRKVSAEVQSVLDRSTVEGNVLTLPEQLDRPTYEAVNKALKAMGGKWNRGKGGHVFDFDPSELVAAAAESGEVEDRVQALGFFETPPMLAARMVSLADVDRGDIVLEPSAGQGRIVDELSRRTLKVYAVEIEPVRAAMLRARFPQAVVVEGDFLHEPLMNPAPGFDAVVMNPPFAKGQDIRHVMAAFDTLAPSGTTFSGRGGRLVAIMSEGPFFRQDRQASAFREWLASVGGESEQLPERTFVESGTGVRTRLVWMERAS